MLLLLFTSAMLKACLHHTAALLLRLQMSYTIDCLKTHTPAALELLCDSVLNPLLLEEEVCETAGGEGGGQGGHGMGLIF